MSLSRIEFKPGIIKDESALGAEGGYIASSLVRFRRGRPQAIGGWEAVASSQFFDPETDMGRAIHSWATLGGERIFAVGTAAGLKAYVGGGIVDITPPHAEGVLTNPFATTTGSAVVTVTHALHGLLSGQEVTFSNAAAVGGITISGAYVVAVVDANSYTITHGSNASGTATGGGYVTYVSEFLAGSVDGYAGGGYGIGPYGQGEYGEPSDFDYRVRTWSLANFGESLVAVPSGGALYQWQPALSYPEIVTNGDFSSSTGWTVSGATIAGNVCSNSLGVGGYVEQTLTLEAGKTYRLAFDLTVSVTATEGAYFRIVDGSAALIDVGNASFPMLVSGSYSRTFVCPPDPAKIRFVFPANFAGNIDNVSVTLEDKAFRIDTAPFTSRSMFVTPERFVVLVGTEETDGDENPMCVRWCDQENIRVWTPSDSNAAGEFILAEGGEAVAGINSRQQAIVFTDSAAYSMTFTGSVGDVYSLRLIGTGCGLASVHAAAEHNGAVFWLSNSNNFYAYSGGAPTIIECPLLRDVIDNIAENQAGKIYAGVNASFSEIWWFIPDDRDGNENSRAAVFNFAENTWVQHEDMPRVAWDQGEIFGYPIAVSADGYAYYHEKGKTANGGALSGYLETSFFDIEDGNNLMLVRRFVPDFEWQEGSLSLTLYGRLYPNGSVSTYGPYTLLTTTQKVDFLKTMREAKLRFSFNDNPADWRMGAIRFDVMKTGSLR